jgi:hypothetical protein
VRMLASAASLRSGTVACPLIQASRRESGTFRRVASSSRPTRVAALRSTRCFVVSATGRPLYQHASSAALHENASLTFIDRYAKGLRVRVHKSSPGFVDTRFTEPAVQTSQVIRNPMTSEVCPDCGCTSDVRSAGDRRLQCSRSATEPPYGSGRRKSSHDSQQDPSGGTSANTRRNRGRRS